MADNGFDPVFNFATPEKVRREKADESAEGGRGGENDEDEE